MYQRKEFRKCATTHTKPVKLNNKLTIDNAVFLVYISKKPFYECKTS
jgi:hypothetical protein